MKNLDNSSLLITGGTGSLGMAITEYVIREHPNFERLVIFSRDEQKQFEMEKKFPLSKYPNIRYFIGDVRDPIRLRRAMRGIDYVIHAAAMKHVHISEYNPDECVKTNINGAQNLIEVCLESDVKSVVALSTDKACAPINLYGATKLASDKLFIAANNITGFNPIKFSVVRYGNVFGSNGSVIPFFLKHKEKKYLPITHPEMTRFNITIQEGVKMVFHALFQSWGGEIFIPKIPSYRILDVAKAICSECEIRVIGIRPGEKLHEEMISISDSFNTYDHGVFYTILPPIAKWKIENYIEEFNAKKVKQYFSYNSRENKHWETVESLKQMIQSYLNNN